MSPQFQTIAALVVVAFAATWLIARTVAKRKNPGCSGDCGCEATELKAKLKR
jgi:hypothetical protein